MRHRRHDFWLARSVLATRTVAPARGQLALGDKPGGEQRRHRSDGAGHDRRGGRSASGSHRDRYSSRRRLDAQNTSHKHIADPPASVDEPNGRADDCPRSVRQSSSAWCRCSVLSDRGTIGQRRRRRSPTCSRPSSLCCSHLTLGEPCSASLLMGLAVDADRGSERPRGYWAEPSPLQQNGPRHGEPACRWSPPSREPGYQPGSADWRCAPSLGLQPRFPIKAPSELPAAILGSVAHRDPQRLSMVMGRSPLGTGDCLRLVDVTRAR